MRGGYRGRKCKTSGRSERKSEEDEYRLRLLWRGGGQLKQREEKSQKYRAAGKVYMGVRNYQGNCMESRKKEEHARRISASTN